jgi:hypothetical protein
MFRAFSRPSSGAQRLQWQPLVLPSYHGDSRAVFVVGPAGPTTNHIPDVTLIQLMLLMMSTGVLETCRKSE